jgi:acyl carrier protein
MTKEEVFLKIQDNLIKEFEMEKDAVVPDAKLYQDLELDSIDAVDILVKMKGLIPGRIDPEAFKKTVTLQDVVDIFFIH